MKIASKYSDRRNVSFITFKFQFIQKVCQCIKFEFIKRKLEFQCYNFVDLTLQSHKVIQIEEPNDYWSAVTYGERFRAFQRLDPRINNDIIADAICIVALKAISSFQVRAQSCVYFVFMIDNFGNVLA